MVNLRYLGRAFIGAGIIGAGIIGYIAGRNNPNPYDYVPDRKYEQLERLCLDTAKENTKLKEEIKKQNVIPGYEEFLDEFRKKGPDQERWLNLLDDKYKILFYEASLDPEEFKEKYMSIEQKQRFDIFHVDKKNLGLEKLDFDDPDSAFKITFFYIHDNLSFLHKE